MEKKKSAKHPNRLVERLKSRSRHKEFARSDDGDHKIGLLPTQGWQRRNLDFISNILLPTIFTQRDGKLLSPEFQSPGEGEIGITWVGHASFLIQIGGVNVLVDPNWALWHGPVKRMRNPGLALGDLPPIDLVLVSHAHFDHLHLASLNTVAAGQPIIVPQGVGNLVKKCGFGEVIELPRWKTIRRRGVTITMTSARHWGARMIHDTYRQFGGFLIQRQGRTVYHCGDSSFFEGFREIGSRAAIDVAILPIGAYEAPSGRQVHMNPEEALDAFEMLGATTMIPMHYATFPLGSEPVDEPSTRLWKGVRNRCIEDRVRELKEGLPDYSAFPRAS